MYYANSQQLYTQVLDLLEKSSKPVAWFCIDLTAVDDVDFTAAATLRQLCGELAHRGVRLVFSGSSEAVRAELDRSGITDLVGPQSYFQQVNDVFNAYRAYSKSG
jgi:SulP family sulfate permease